jgi:hypothetical protein
MMQKVLTSLSALLLTVLLISGCASFPEDIAGVFATEVSDLEKVRSSGKTETFPLSFDTAFDKVIDILKKNNLTIYQTNRGRKYIIVMGFQKQIDTTRVGVFFDPVSDNETRITLSSLSSMTLPKAEAVIFGGLRK